MPGGAVISTQSDFLSGQFTYKYFPVKIILGTQFCFKTRRNQMCLKPPVPSPQL